MLTMDGTHSYGYDNLNRLTSAVHPSTSSLPVLNETFSYDAVGNRLSDAVIAGYSYNAANELTSNSSFTYVYDNNGNQTGVTSKLTNQTTTYNYDGQNELVGASMPSGNASYQYDAMGRRVERTTNTVVGQPIYYVYDNQDIVAMVDGSGNLIALFTRGPNIDEPLEIRQGSSGTEYFIHADALGSVVAHSDGNGAVVERIEYEAYGQPVFLDLRSGSPVVGAQSFTGDPFAFAGVFYDGETGFYYLSERQTYDPSAGRFGQPDPMGVDAGVNSYLYAKADPILLTDPYGLLTCTYEIGKHRLHCVNNAGKPFTTTNVVSGNTDCKNKTINGCELKSNVGPIPRGGYRIFPPKHNPNYPDWLWLKPYPGGTKRPGLYLHPGTYSMGCITLNPVLFPEIERWSIEDNGGSLNVLP
jgi:RHS repeat-associated protein